MPSRAASVLLEGRPLVGFVAVLLTTGGHTMNLRELGVSRGWVAAEVYVLQSCYLFCLALTMLACPTLGRGWSARRVMLWGLVLAMLGPVLNVVEIWEPLLDSLAGRALAGVGAGMVIYFAPNLLGPQWEGPLAWSVILCPVVGPGVISAATMTYESSDWQHGFIFEGAIAAIGLLVLWSTAGTPESRSRSPRGSLAYFPGLVVASASLVYVLHWGQLHGWMEGPDITAATALGAAAAVVSLYLAWPQLDWRILGENWVRLALFFFGGVCQFFHAYIMNVYGGTMVNLSSWQRAWLIWPLPIGIATSLFAAALLIPHLRRRRGRVVLGLPVAIVGLLLLSAGLDACYRCMMEWPYWSIRDVVDLNWFSAPGQWELAPGRFLMGTGIGLFMAAMDAQFSPDPEREEVVRPFLNVVQFIGGGIAAAVLINFMIIGHKVHYSYSADRDTIQAEELSQRGDLLTDVLRQAGQDAPEQSSQLLMYRFVNYEADNLMFATIFAAFLLAALVVVGFFSGLWIWRGLHRT
ncbi:hypothetical protein VT85_26605 (plasmid) [Planctomyces sp. SH-PL62]|nr:hypothetical protein VT85_26605 [Planctomyces sp. SH-PL62]